MSGGNMAENRNPLSRGKGKPGHCDCDPNSKACKKRQGGTSGNRCHQECNFAKK